jgi:hypothetical protein
MAESSAKIRLTLDGQQVSREATKLSGQIGKMGEGFIKGVLGIGAMVGGLKRAVEAANEFQKSLGEATKEAGQTALKLAEVSRQFKSSDLATLSSELKGGARSQSEGIAFLSDLAEKTKGRASSQQQVEGLRAFMSGGYTKDEAISKSRGGISREDISKRVAGMPEGARRELQFMEQEKVSGLMIQQSKLEDRAAAEKERLASTLVESLNSRAFQYGKLKGADIAMTPDFFLRQEAMAAIEGKANLGSGFSENTEIFKQMLIELRGLGARPVAGSRGEGGAP